MMVVDAMKEAEVVLTGAATEAAMGAVRHAGNHRTEQSSGNSS